MIKKLITIAFATVALLALSGCTGEDSYYDHDDELTTLFLIDQDGNSYANVPYICDSMTHWDKTASNGEFSFYPGENCEFDFDGLIGNYENDYYDDDIIYIVDYTEDGKGRIPYECESFGTGSTYGDGSFDYNENDECVFFF